MGDFGPAARAARAALTAAFAASLLALAPVLAANDAPLPPEGAPVASTSAACPPPVATDDGAPAADRGLLWRLSRGGHHSYLFGTLHVGRPSWQRFGPATLAALDASDTLVLELDPTDPAVQAELAAPAPAPALPQPLQARLAGAAAQACVQALAFTGLHPALQVSILTVLEARWLGLDPSYALETLLGARARVERRRIVALETAAQQKRLLAPTRAAETPALVAQALDQLADGTSRRVLARLVAAWEQGDLGTLSDYARWCECADSAAERAFWRRLNDERNAPMADRISALHRQGRRLFVAVGALHLTGAQALPRLLSRRGFTLERVQFLR